MRSLVLFGGALLLFSCCPKPQNKTIYTYKRIDSIMPDRQKIQGDWYNGNSTYIQFLPDGIFREVEVDKDILIRKGYYIVGERNEVFFRYLGSQH